MAADPGLEPIALVAPPRHPVEDRVVAHQELDSAPPGRIGLVDGAVLECEGAHSIYFRDVCGDVGPGRGRILTRDRRQLALGWHVLAHLLHGTGGPRDHRPSTSRSDSRPRSSVRT